MKITSNDITKFFELTYWEMLGVNLSFILEEFDLYTHELLYARIISEDTIERTPKQYLVINKPKNI